MSSSACPVVCALGLEGDDDWPARAKARGVQFGRPSKLTAYQRQEALQRLQEGHAQTDVARLQRIAADHQQAAG
jgi:hypothetical protein